MFKEIALPCAAIGIPVFPLSPGTKIPPATLDGWQRKATTDLAQIEAWNDENPDYNVALVAKAVEGGFCCLEFDVRGGMAQAAEEMGQARPETMLTQSGRGFGHWWFKHTERSMVLGNRQAHLPEKGEDGKPKEWFSFRAHDRYLVGAGSIHPNGNAYRALRSEEPIPMPDWLCDWIDKHSQNPGPSRKEADRPSSPVMDDDFDLDDFLSHVEEACNVSVLHDYESNGVIYCALDGCPNNDGAEHSNHTGRKTCITMGDFGLGFQCFADQCTDFGITALLLKMREDGNPYEEPIWKEREDQFSVEDIETELELPSQADSIVPVAQTLAASEPLDVAPVTAEASLSASQSEAHTVGEDPLKFPDDAMYGKLGGMAYAMKLPRGLAYPALIGCYSIKPDYDELDGSRINAYVVLLAGVGGGKDTAIKRALQILKLEKGVEYEKATPASDRGLGELLGDRTTGKKGQERVSGPKKMLLVCDEFMEVLQKSRIENSGLFQTLQTLFDDNRKVFADKRGRQTVDCRVSIVGSVPVNEKNSELFSELFGRRSSHGLLSRILLGYSGTRFNYKKWNCPDISIGKSAVTRIDVFEDGDDCELPSELWQPAPHVEGLTPEARDLYEAWEDPADPSGRMKFYLMKIALLTASANGDPLVTLQGIQAAIRFMAWQARLREVFKPGIAEDIIDARATERIINTLRGKAEKLGDKEYIPWRKVSHDCKWAESFGAPVVERVVNALINCGELEPKEIEDDKGNMKADKRWVRVVGKIPARGKELHQIFPPSGSKVGENGW